MREKKLSMQIAVLKQERDALLAALDDVIRSYEGGQKIEDKYLQMAKLTVLKVRLRNDTQPDSL